MTLRCVLITTSFITCAVSSALVVLFIYFYIVPASHNPSFIETQCAITDIISVDGNSNCSVSENVNKPCGLRSCIHVNVEYVVSSSESKRGVLLKDERLANSIEENSFKCFCTDCNVYVKNATSVLYNTDQELLRTGQYVMCRYHLPHESSRRTPDLFNIMLWPTLFFIVSFVGSFFSCIYLAGDGYGCHSIKCSQFFP